MGWGSKSESSALLNFKTRIVRGIERTFLRLCVDLKGLYYSDLFPGTVYGICMNPPVRKRILESRLGEVY